MQKKDKTFLFETSLDWTEAHQGIAHSPDKPNILVACPPVFRKESPIDQWSPEELFVSSVEVCLMLEFIALVKRRGASFTSYRSKARGKLEFVDRGKLQFTRIDVDIDVEVPEEQAPEIVEALVHESEERCLISNSLKTEVAVNPSVKTVAQG